MKNFKLTSSFRSWKMVTMSILSCLFTVVAIQSSVAQTNNYFGTTGTLNTNVWSTNPAGPYTSALNATGGAIINFQNAGTFDAGTMDVSAINATANMTYNSGTGTLGSYLSGIVPIDVSSGVTLDLGSTLNLSGASGAGYIKNGLGVLATAGNTYRGGFTLNAGTIVLRSVNAMGSGTGNTLTINGGTVAANLSRILSGKYPGGITIGGNFTLGATTGLALSTANISFNNILSLGNGTSHEITIGGTGDYTLGGVISGIASNLTINATAAGKIFLTAENTYSGTTTINGGELHLSNMSGPTLPSSANVVVNGGKLVINQDQTINNLTLATGASIEVAMGKTLVVNGTYSVFSSANIGSGNIVINGTLKIEQGGYPGSTGTWSYGASGTLEFANTSGLYNVNNEVWWPTTNGPRYVRVSSTGGLLMNVNRTIANNLTTVGEVAGNSLTINGFININSGGFFSSAPIYGPASTLAYNTGSPYGRGFEWSTLSGPGYPNNVLIQGNTGLDLGNGGIGALRRISGNLTINFGSALYMDFGANDMTQPLEINGNLTLDGTLSLSDVLGGDLKVRGDFNHYGTINTKDRAVFFDGTADQTIGGQLLELDFVVVDKASGDLILGDNLLCNKTLTLTNGKINTNSYQVEVTCTGDVNRTNGWVNGNLKVCIPTGATTRTLAVGDAAVYGGVDVSFGNVTVSGDLTPTTAVIGGPPSIGAVPGGSGLSQTKYVNRKWTVTNTGVTFDNYNATFHFAPGDIAGGANPNNFIVGKKDGGTWSAPTVGTKTATSSQITGATSFSEFSVAEACVPPSIASISAAANPICGDATTTLSAIDVMGDGATVTWWTATGGTGTPVGSGLTSNLVGPGTYYAYVTGDCGTAEASFTVIAKTNVDITGITPTTNPICAEQTTIITANGVVGDGAVVTWYTGPNGTGSNLGSGLSLPGAATGTSYYALVTGECGAPDEVSFALTEAGPVHNVTTNRYYCTIQAAINATSTVTNNVIAVTSGTYTENVTISKAINLRGANFGTAGCASRVTESVVTGGAGSAFTITSNGVTIDGFEMTGLYGVSGTGFTKLGIRNNKIAASGAGISVATVVTSSGNTLTIEDNCIDLNTQEVSSNPTIGVFVNGVTGTDAILLDDNTITDGFYGYLLNGVNTTAASIVSDGVITGVLQGLAIVNTVGSPTLVGSNLSVSGMNMSSFLGASSNSNTNFHAGVYTFTAGTTIPSNGITLAINNCTIDGTLTNSPSGAAIYLGDFSAGGVTVQNVTVDECTITDNRNRGIDARGRVNATVTESTFTGNGSAPDGSDGNDGYTMLAQRGATITASNNFITHPVTSTHLVTAFRTGNSPTNSIIATNNKININGNANGRGASTGTGSIIATCNSWGSIVPATNAALMTGSITYIPWLTDDTDGMLATAGFQPATACSIPCELVLGSSKSDPSCFGATDGTATVTVSSGGVAPFTYLWSNSGTSATISPLAPGTYTVTVTNANGCTATTSLTITQPTQITGSGAVTSNYNGSQLSCNGASDGAITVTASGGTGTYQYSLNGGTYQSSNVFSGLTAGTYTIDVKDANDCEVAFANVTITAPTVPTASISNFVNVICNGGSMGSATVSAADGTIGYTYLWSNGATGATASGLVAGTYNVTVNDANLCAATAMVIITQPDPLTGTSTQVNVLCNGASSGSIDLSVSGGTAPYTYLWSNGATTQDISSLAAGPYSVTVNDNILAADNTPYFDAFSTTHLPGGAQPGTLAGTVDLQNGWTTRDAFTTATTVGKWDQQVIQVNDVNGNRKVFRMSNANTSSTYTSQVFSATSGQVAGETNAALWNNRGTNGSSPLTPAQFGAYAANNTFYTKLKFRSATGAAQSGLSLTLSPSAKQSAVRMGFVQIVDSGSGFNLNFYETLADGTFPPSPTVIATGLSYTALHTLEMAITFVDGVSIVSGQVYGNDVVKVWLNGSLIHTGTTWESYYYSTPAERNAVTSGPGPRLQAVDALIFRVAGTAAPATAGNGFYFEDFRISNTVPAVTLYGLAALSGCTTATSTTITQPAAPVTVSTTQTNVTCNGTATGTINLNVSGGTPPYTYSWNSGATTEDISGLVADTYGVTVTDANGSTSGCTAILDPALVITQPDVLMAISTNDSPIYAGSTLNLSSNVSGGTMTYNYSWTGPDGFVSTDANPSITNATVDANGTYYLTVTDANGCAANTSTSAIIYGITLFVNDNSATGDVYTTALGDDNNPGTPSAPFATIAKAIMVANNGNSIYVDAGTYPETVTVNKRLTIDGAGSTGQTHINGSITFSASGIDASNRSTVKNMSVTNSAGDGVIINNGVSYITAENVASINNSADGVEILGGNITNTYLLLKDMRINDNGTGASGTGIRMGGLANVNGLTLMGGEVKRNAQIGFTYNSSVSAIGLTNVLIDGVTFEHNGDDTYASTAQLGTGDISFFSFDGIATLQNVTVIGGPSSNAAHIGVQFRGKNTSTPSGLITINGLNVTGSYKRPTLAGSDPSGPGYGLVFMNYTDVSNVSLNNVDVNCTDGHGLFVAGLTTTLNVGDASLTAQNSNSSHIFVGTSTQNNVFTNVNATGATFNGVPASGATSAQYFAIEDKIVHKLDNAALGYVSVKANHDFVTTNSGSLQRGIDAASNGWTVNVNSGTYEEFNINVNKSVTILGANAGVACSGGRGSESIIQNLVNNGLPVINVTADGVTLNGLEIINPWGNSAVDGSGRSNLSIIFNKIHNVGTSRGSGNIYGVRYLVGSATASNVTISDNCISNVANTTMALGNTGGLWFGQSDSPGTLSSLTIERNTISDINAASNKGAWGITIGTGSAAAGSIVAPVIRYNNITAITGGYSSAIDLTGKTPNVVVTNNFVNNINSSGVSPFSAGVTVGAANTGSTSLSINENSFTNVLYGITNANAGTVNGTCNWYGSASGNVVAPKILGNVNYISWLVNGMNDAPSTPGFQPVTLPLPGNCSGTPVFITSAIPSPNQFCQNDGEIEVEFNGGTGTYTVEWTGGTPVSGIAGSPYTISGLTNGNYTITVTDINGTWATIDATVTISPIRRTSVGPVYTYYSTIQDAINAAVAGEVIDICAGTYTETIIINKALTINGPNVDISGTSLLRNEEAVLLNCSIDISNAGNTTLDGLHILRTDVTAGSQIFLDGGGVNTVQNCIFERNDPTIILDPLNSSDLGINMRAISTTTAGGNKNILNNKFTGSLAGGLFSRHRTWNNGIYVDQGPFTVNISGNTIENCRTAINVDDYNNNVTIASNTLDNNGTHIAVGGASSTGSYTLGMNTFKTPGSAIINLSNIAESFRLNITSSTYIGVAFNAMTPAQLFDVEARMYHKESYGPASKGKVIYFAGNQYVNNFTVPATKIDVINNSIKYADAPETINLQEGTYNQKVVVDKSNLTLQGITSDKTLYKINGSGITGPGPLAPLPGSGIVLNNLITGTTIQNLTVENFTGTNGNSHAGIYGINGNNGTTVNNVALLNNISASGFYANGPVDDVEVINSMVNNNGGSARGIVLWNGLKTNINISNNTLSNNRCCGIELSDGNASAVTVVGNTIDVGTGDNAIGLIGLNATVGANLIQGNTITGGGRFGIEIKNPAGGVTVNSNSVTLTIQDGDLRDRAGIAVFRRGVLNGNVDVPNGVTVTNNTITGYVQTNMSSSSTGFGIVVEGTNHMVNTNTLNNNGIAIQLQAGHSPYVANEGSSDALHNGNQGNLADNYFGRGNSPELCNVTTTGNTFSGNTLNAVRIVTGGGIGTIQTDPSPITPTVDPVADQLLLCFGASTTTVIFTGNNLTGVAYNWSNDNTSIGLAASGTGNITSFVVTNTTDVTQIATITVTPVVNGCSGTPKSFMISVLPDWAITASVGFGGSISPAGVTTLCSGAGQAYTITPDPGYGILDVLVDGVSNPAAIGSGMYTFTNVTANHSIHATFNVLTTISGNIIWEHDNDGVKDATVSVTGAGSGSDDTDVNGNYSVTLVANGDFTITPTKNINRFNGVDIADAMIIQQHVVSPIFTDPYKWIAADVNRNNSVTNQDALIIKFALLSNSAALNAFNKFWRFVPSTPVLTTLPPWGFAESISLTGASGNHPNNDFIGIKLGDVNGDGDAAYKGIPNVALITNDRVLKAGEDIDVSFKVKNFNEIGAYQLAMSFDTDQLLFDRVVASEFIPFSDDNFGTINIADGELRAVWSRANGFTISDGSEIFAIRFRSLKDGSKLSDVLNIDEDNIPARSYKYTHEAAGIDLVYNVLTAVTEVENKEGLRLLQNRPNPFHEQTTIGFELPVAGEATIKVYNSEGQFITERKGKYASGYHEEVFSFANGSGVLFYELVTDKGILMRKMIQIRR